MKDDEFKNETQISSYNQIGLTLEPHYSIVVVNLGSLLSHTFDSL